MFSRALKPVASVAVQNGAKFSTTSQKNFKVVVAGAAGGIGQPLALLLKQNSLVTRLALYDIAPVTPGVAVDLSHMDTPAQVTGHKGPEQLAAAVECADLVVIPAGVPRKPGMTRDDLFNTNASIVRDIADCVAKNAPKAIMAIITNPVNSMVPIASEVLKKAGVYDPAKVLGVTTLDVVRAAAFIGEINCVDPTTVKIPVIGGHSGVTIIPVLSQSCPAVNLTDQSKIEALTKRIQEAGTEVVKAKAGGGSATLSMAYAGARLACAVLRGLKGDSDAVECAYVKSDLTEATYFANPVQFGPNGVEKNLGYGELNDYEKELLKAAIPELLKNIKTGENFANK
ncbi:PREDICTED: probable malate dehydrogenase, mitochondrial [Papilio xuthus]|uniref:Malate dehydrogenase n=2 Tax=Papilio xuthus TaxID=66420 RepID=A0AAJ6Z9T1_PAPXU|nr:PREDICTED: probable malate dehydrogenase, mitochondrial [Papilio xuthus]